MACGAHSILGHACSLHGMERVTKGKKGAKFALCSDCPAILQFFWRLRGGDPLWICEIWWKKQIGKARVPPTPQAPWGWIWNGFLNLMDESTKDELKIGWWTIPVAIRSSIFGNALFVRPMTKATHVCCFLRHRQVLTWRLLSRSSKRWWNRAPRWQEPFSTVTFQGEKVVAAISWRQRKTTRWLAKKSNVVVQKLPAKDFTCGLCLDALPCHPALFVSGALFQRDLPGIRSQVLWTWRLQGVAPYCK